MHPTEQPAARVGTYSARKLRDIRLSSLANDNTLPTWLTNPTLGVLETEQSSANLVCFPTIDCKLRIVHAL
jgi:hypothetical protein